LLEIAEAWRRCAEQAKRQKTGAARPTDGEAIVP
jgi:hypothetical protein